MRHIADRTSRQLKYLLRKALILVGLRQLDRCHLLDEEEDAIIDETPPFSLADAVQGIEGLLSRKALVTQQNRFAFADWNSSDLGTEGVCFSFSARLLQKVTRRPQTKAMDRRQGTRKCHVPQAGPKPHQAREVHA